MYGSVTNTHVKENPYMVVIPSSVLKSIGKYCFMKPCMVTLLLPILIGKQNTKWMRNHPMCKGYPLAT
jgi:hypothetical protein